MFLSHISDVPFVFCVVFLKQQKRLNFTGIDKYHGTGAFDHSKFPEWNSIFLEYVDHPEEIMIIEIRQRRRQRKLSGFNDYFDSLSSSSSGSSSTGTSTIDNDTDTEKNKKKTAPWKPKKITNRKLSDTSNYLETMSSFSSTPTSTPQPSSSASKTKNQNKTGLIPAKATTNKNKIKSRNNPISKKKYLDIQGSSSSSYNQKKERRPTEKQSTKLSNNPFLDEVSFLFCSFELYCSCLLFLDMFRFSIYILYVAYVTYYMPSTSLLIYYLINAVI